MNPTLAARPDATAVAAPAPGLHARAVLLSGSCFTLLAGASISPALPGIYAEFADTPNAALLSRQVLSITPLFIAVGAALAGLIVDRFGCRRLLLWSILFTGIGGTAGFFMDSLYSLLATRVVLGLAVGGVTTACITLIGDYFVDDERRRFLSYQAAAMKAGAVVFLVLGGMLASISWRHPFLVDLLAFLIVPGALYALRDRPRVLRHRAATPPRLPLRVMALVVGTAFVAQVLFFAIPTQLPFHMADTLRASPQQVGMAIAASTLTSAVVASQYFRVNRRLSFGPIFAVVFTLLGAGLVLLGRAGSVGAVVGAVVIVGVGVGLLQANLSMVVLEKTAPELRGRAVGGMTTAQMLGQFASPLLVAWPVTLLGLPGTFMLLGGCALVVAAAFALTRFR